MASHASSGLGLSRRSGGYGRRASNRSFTLHTPPAHPASEDSLARASVRPHEISFVTTPRLLRTFVAVLALAVSGFAALSTASPAGAATECGKKVLADWFDNGRIDRLYPLNCYEEAIDAIPDDLRDYADAEEVITRALQAALSGKLAPGGADPTPNDDDPANPGSNGGNGSGGSGGRRLRRQSASGSGRRHVGPVLGADSPARAGWNVARTARGRRARIPLASPERSQRRRSGRPRPARVGLSPPAAAGTWRLQ